jgi:DNA-binding transcriptional LysR family regulator
MISYSLSSLLVFSTVVKCRSFSKAAAILYMTQPGVSNHVAQLEAQTGMVLIKRSRGKFELTREGKSVYKAAERIESVTRELDEKLKLMRKDRKPSLSIGTTVNYARRVMPYVLGGFQKHVPDIKIKLDYGASVEMERTLIEGRNDVIIVANQHVSKKVHAIPFVREELVLVTSRDHPLSQREAVSLADIRPYPFIIREEGSATRSKVLNAFSEMDIIPSVLIEANSMEFTKEWVAQGKGVSILIDRAVEADDRNALAAVRLVEPLFLEVSVAYLKSRRYDPSIQAFINYLKDTTGNPNPGAPSPSSTSPKKLPR